MSKGNTNMEAFMKKQFENQTPFEQYLRKQNLSDNTVTSYLWTIKYYTENYEDFSKEDLLAYKGWLLEYFKPKTVNLRIQTINKYLVFTGKEKMQLKQVKVQQKNFLENVISNADYQYFKAQLKADDNIEWYFVVWFLGATGARVSELTQIKVEHVNIGWFDLYSKGGKLRRLYYSKAFEGRSPSLAKINQQNFWLCFSESFWRTYYYTRLCNST